ncbi:uncharacterized protein LOC134836767 [Culicoides brevitarsis]|uniref:uncharacterized protein LOC134836767 n=1 Tax=Culicoides brevitarsis TaxID=469753 RepID=UPI00307BFB68
MLTNINELKEEQKDKHPGFGSYFECMSRAYLTGLATFSLVFPGLHFSQKIFARYLPYNPSKLGVLVSAVIASAGTYKVTADRTLDCQIAWVDSEKKPE